MAFAVCIVPVAPVRRSHSHEAEMTSQLLFGEGVVMHEATSNGFYRITCSHDGYEGYCMGNQLMPVERVREGMIFTAWSNSVMCPDGSIMQVPFAASFPGNLDGIFRVPDPSCLSEPNMAPLSRFSLYLNTSYQWGGRSVFGADCSGFIQTLMKASGIRLPRDASQQVELGREVKLEDARAGDLAFFDINGKVVHVGMYLGDGEIVHAFGKVRIDKLTNEGIKDTGHRLFCMRRV